jgi:hypothetical protein
MAFTCDRRICAYPSPCKQIVGSHTNQQILLLLFLSETAYYLDSEEWENPFEILENPCCLSTAELREKWAETIYWNLIYIYQLYPELVMYFQCLKPNQIEQIIAWYICYILYNIDYVDRQV